MQKINRTKENSEQKKNENKREPGTKEELLKVQKRTFTKDRLYEGRRGAAKYLAASDCRQRPRHSAEDFSLKEAKSQYFQDF